MAVTLNAPFSWEAADPDTAAMLDQLQPNILKAHTREFLTMLFLRIDAAVPAKAFLEALVQPASGKPLVKSARVHLREIKAFKAAGTPGTAYVGVGLSAAGYAALGVAAGKRPSDPSFLGGMQSAALGDPPPGQWEPHLRAVVHAVVLVGDAKKAPRDAALAKVRALMAASGGLTVLGEEVGKGLHNQGGDGIEHFGYVDGRSQPLFLEEDVAAETLRGDGATNWNPALAPNRVIVPDPAAPSPATQFGSYFVFRKLEQNVKRFKTEATALATRLTLKAGDRNRAGAMIVGRFEDGTPLTAQATGGAHHPVLNDFTYDSDPLGGKCPHFAHIRKMNPRGSGGFEPVAGERLHLMARRGQTYGTRADDPNDGKTANKPSAGVGLLFMAFNAELAGQFEFVQKNWANFAGFPQVPGGAPPPGLDLVIGQGARPAVQCPLTWGADAAAGTKHTAAAKDAVTMRGGEYFFMPSLAFLRTPP